MSKHYEMKYLAKRQNMRLLLLGNILMHQRKHFYSLGDTRHDQTRRLTQTLHIQLNRFE